MSNYTVGWSVLSGERWAAVAKPDPEGHRYFLHRATGKWSVCDDSGSSPDYTDDGPLWVDPDRPVSLWEDGYYSIPVTVPRTGEKSWTTGFRKEALWVVHALGLKLKRPEDEIL